MQAIRYASGICSRFLSAAGPECWTDNLFAYADRVSVCSYGIYIVTDMTVNQPGVADADWFGCCGVVEMERLIEVHLD